jgi:hypothetical protein
VRARETSEGGRAEASLFDVRAIGPAPLSRRGPLESYQRVRY